MEILYALFGALLVSAPVLVGGDKSLNLCWCHCFVDGCGAVWWVWQAWQVDGGVDYRLVGGERALVLMFVFSFFRLSTSA